MDLNIGELASIGTLKIQNLRLNGQAFMRIKILIGKKDPILTISGNGLEFATPPFINTLNTRLEVHK